MVPSGDKLGPRFEDLVPPRDLAAEGEGLGEAAELRGGGGVWRVKAMHFPWRMRERERGSRKLRRTNGS